MDYYIELLSKDFSVFITTPENLKIDERAPICCKYNCVSTYGSRCYCPPHSISPREFMKFRKKYSTAIILARCYSPKDWTYIKKDPNNQFNPKRHKVYFRRWCQINAWSKYKKIYQNLKETDSFFLFGTSLHRCYKCKNSGKKCKSEIAWPSPEAVGIDCVKTLSQFNYVIKFGVTKDIIRVGMILTNDFSDLIGYQKNTYPSTNNTKDKQQMNLSKINEIIGVEECKIIKVKDLEIEEPEFDFNLWEKALLWKWKESKVKKYSYENTSKKIHQYLFMLNNYFCLSVNLEKNKRNLNMDERYGLELIY